MLCCGQASYSLLGEDAPQNWSVWAGVNLGRFSLPLLTDYLKQKREIGPLPDKWGDRVARKHPAIISEPCSGLLLEASLINALVNGHLVIWAGRSTTVT